MNNKLVAGLTTKNEDWIIEKTLTALSNFCEEIVVYDDGSTDKTELICKSFDKVDWRVRPEHNPLLREEAKQRLELINILGEHDPDYVLLLDADEIPTPSIVNFMENMNNDVFLWRSRMINLWDDETKYRVDKYNTKFNREANFDPFSDNAWFKYPLMKFDKNINYSYDLEVQKGGCSRYHPAPNNPGKVEEQEDFYIIHYGKLCPGYLNGEKLEFYAKIEELDGRGSYESRLDHHKEFNRVDTVETRDIPTEWIWK
tara:strand:- start:347 stop:1117 length:771 start_codon:yes stop_codon:yes gene_type:complete